MGALWSQMLSALYAKELNVAIVGLENSGKTTLLQRVAGSNPIETVPTIGMNVKMARVV